MTLLLAASLRTLLPDPGAGSVTGVKLPDTPPGNPVTEKATAALKPPLIVTFSVTLWFAPGKTGREFAEGVTLKPGTTLASLQWLTRTEPSIEPRPVA